jgi:hypothetical protein
LGRPTLIHARVDFLNRYFDTGIGLEFVDPNHGALELFNLALKTVRGIFDLALNEALFDGCDTATERFDSGNDLERLFLE